MTKGIYKITNKKTNNYYIGESLDISQRWITHKKELRENTHCNQLLQRDWNLYGEDNFLFEIALILDTGDIGYHHEQILLYIYEHKYMKDAYYNVEDTLHDILNKKGKRYSEFRTEHDHSLFVKNVKKVINYIKNDIVYIENELFIKMKEFEYKLSDLIKGNKNKKQILKDFKIIDDKDVLCLDYWNSILHVGKNNLKNTRIEKETYEEIQKLIDDNLKNYSNVDCNKKIDKTVLNSNLQLHEVTPIIQYDENVFIKMKEFYDKHCFNVTYSKLFSALNNLSVLKKVEVNGVKKNIPQEEYKEVISMCSIYDKEYDKTTYTLCIYKENIKVLYDLLLTNDIIEK